MEGPQKHLDPLLRCQTRKRSPRRGKWPEKVKAVQMAHLTARGRILKARGARSTHMGLGLMART